MLKRMLEKFCEDHLFVKGKGGCYYSGFDIDGYDLQLKIDAGIHAPHIESYFFPLKWCTSVDALAQRLKDGEIVQA